MSFRGPSRDSQLNPGKIAPRAVLRAPSAMVVKITASKAPIHRDSTRASALPTTGHPGSCSPWAASVKVAWIVPGGFHPGDQDNVIPVLTGLARAISTRHDLHVFAFGGPGRITRDSLEGAVVHQLGDATTIDPPGPARNVRRLARLAGQLAWEFHRARRPPFQALHAFWANEPGLMAGLLGRLASVPVVVSVGGGEAVWLPDIGYGGSRSSVGRRVLAASLRLADQVTVGSEYARTFLDPPVARRARVIPLGIDCGRFRAAPTRPEGPPWRLIYVGSLNAVKNHGALLEAFSELTRRLGSDVTLDCVGEDTLHGAVQARARSLGIGDRVRFRGFLPNGELAELYRGAHLNLLPSRYESQSVALLEAAAAGVPTVGFAVGLLPSLAPEAGCAVSGDRPGALADAIHALLIDRPRRFTMAAAAQAFAHTHDVSWTARAFEEIYRRLQERPRPPASAAGASGQ